MPTPPKSAAAHFIEGTIEKMGHDKRERFDHEPAPELGVGMPPANLSARQHEVWVRLTQDTPAGVLGHTDRATFLRWVTLEAAQLDALERFNASGAQTLRQDLNGNWKRNPHWVDLERIGEQMRKLMAELGYSPAGRTRISVQRPGGDNPLDKFTQPFERRPKGKTADTA